jgi:hypothetical protein
MMLYQPYLADNQPRRGVVLLVVIVMLALFAAVGITFVFYSEASSAASDSWKQSQVLPIPDMDPEMAFSLFLQQLIYDVPDDATGVYSSLRGHSLLRNMWGLNYTYANNNINGTITLGNNTVAFNGAGRLHYPVQGLPISPTTDQDNFNLINYTYFQSDGFLRDPGCYKFRADLTKQRGTYVEEFNPPYTYPDLNCLALGAVDKNGNLLMPSYYRQWLFDPQNQGYPANQNWTNAIGKYLTLRPRPADNSGFPGPEDGRGLDVRNLPGAGPLDSHWININAPVFRLPDGRKYTMLVAPLIIDLDGKVNLNVHGNIKGQTNTHASNTGNGPWEVAINQILNKDPTKTEWTKLFLGQPGQTNGTFQVVGRYGPSGMPLDPSNTIPPGRNDHYYARTDVDGAVNTPNDGNVQRILLPGMNNTFLPLTSLFPYFDTNRYQDGNSSTENLNHPAAYFALNPQPPGPGVQGYNRNFRVSNLEKLYRSGSTGDEALTSELMRLCPTNMSDPTVRRLVTLLSANLDRAGAPPWYYPTNALAFGPLGGNFSLFPQGQPALAFPNPATQTAPAATATSGTEFGTDWRSNIAALTKIDLRRTLRQYPLYNGPLQNTSSYLRRFDIQGGATTYTDFLNAQADRQKLADDLYRRLLVVCGVPPVVTAASPTNSELATRRWLAQLAVNIVDYIDEDDISTPFNFYTTADAGTTNPAQFNLNDTWDQDVPTPTTTFKKEVPKYWVFGTEMPRLVITEALMEHKSTPAILNNNYQNAVYVELFNPLSATAGTLPLQDQDKFNVQLYVPPQVGQTYLNPNYNNGYAPYKIVVASGLWGTAVTNNNVTGKPEYSPALGARWSAETNDTTDFAQSAKMVGNNQAQTGNYGGMTTPFIPPNDPSTGQGYFLIGGNGAVATVPTFPNIGPDWNNAISRLGGVPATTPYLGTLNLQYKTTFIGNPARVNTNDKQVTVFLRRLANPHLPPDLTPAIPDPTNPGSGVLVPNPRYNPYVTIDYLENVPNHDKTTEVTYATRGKRQPFAGKWIVGTGGPNSADPTNSQVLDTTTKPPGATTGTFHSFGLINTQRTGSLHYHWLTHLDRAPMSPIELLLVSLHQPHQLTQKFIVGDDRQPGNRNNHTGGITSTAQWFNPANRIYRLFEYLECRGPVGWSQWRGGRIVGQININTIWDLETFLALCDPKLKTGANSLDPNNPSYFTNQDIGVSNGGVPGPGIFRNFLQKRSPGLLSTTPQVGSVGITGATDKPFWSLATGPLVNAPQVGSPPYNNPFPAGVASNSLQNTLFWRGGVNNSGLFDVAITGTNQSGALTPTQQHPYIQNLLLSKIFNNVTTRSNTFAVFLTVGFFECDDSTLPVKLGAELGRDQNRQVRHRMFAIIDRTQLQRAQTLYTTTATSSTNAAFGPGQATLKLQPLAGSTNPLSGTTNQGYKWNIVPGTVLTITDSNGANAETVVVTSLAGATNDSIVATFYNTTQHTPTVTVTMQGNPGPRQQTPFNPHNSSLIAHFSIID